MPNLGHTMEEGKVSEWLKQVGQPVSKGEVIAVVESDKASFDVDCPADGVLLAIHAPAGTVVLLKLLWRGNTATRALLRMLTYADVC